MAILIGILGTAAIAGSAADFDKAWVMMAITAWTAGGIALTIGRAGRYTEGAGET
ncbi:MAG: hypothetical protein ACSLFD_01620 [Solirubrobacterales bacterium]